MLTAARSDRVASVLVVDAVPFLPALFGPTSPEAAAAMRPGIDAQLAAQDDATWLAQARAGLPRQAISEPARARVLADAERADVAASKAAFAEMMTTDYAPMLAEVDVPVTVLVPYDPAMGLDRDAVLARYAAFYADVPGVTLKVVDGSRHFLMLDAPDAFADVLDEALVR